MNIWLDITTTLAWSRPALGIVRVEAETLRYFLAAGDERVRFCRFDQETGNYVEVSHEVILNALARLDAGSHEKLPTSSTELQPARTAVKRDARESARVSLKTRLKQVTLSVIAFLPHRYQARVQRLAYSGYMFLRKLAGKLPHAFVSNIETQLVPQLEYKVLAQPFNVGDTYISLGLDWDQKDLPFLYTVKKKLGLKVILFCYDIIPILMPEYCVSGVPEKFPEYFVNVAWCSDCILSISECSRNDLKNYLESVGAPVPALGVVRLGDDLRAAITLPPSPEIAGLIQKEYILFVSTVEARKNHKILYQAYKKLLESGNKDIPLLIFVGMQGWGVDVFINSLEKDYAVHPYIHRLHHVSDSDLIHLYKNCLFTVYPSLYEGWGLPVAESLVYGKFCIASDVASIPEVGGSFIEYISPQNTDLWAERLNWYFQNRGAINERQEAVIRNYQPSTWQKFGATILNTALTLQDKPIR